MNDLLQLKGEFQPKKGKAPGPVELPKGAVVDSDGLRELAEECQYIADYWIKRSIEFKPLASVCYRGIEAKSNRIKKILSDGGDASLSIVGARFEGCGNSTHHVITYCVSIGALRRTAELLRECACILDAEFGGAIDHEGLKSVTSNGLRTKNESLKKTTFAQVIRDAHFVSRIVISQERIEAEDWSVVSIYDTGYSDVREFLKGLGLPLPPNRVIGNVVRLNKEELSWLTSEYPFLVSMAVRDISEIVPIEPTWGSEPQGSIPAPSNEPVVGVIDTPFDDRVYFADWVESHDMLPEDIDATPNDRNHGTMVSSLIVDGPAINPELDDNCGRFRVRHFGIAPGGRSSSFAFMRAVRSIVESNRDIKVWNVSLGSVNEVTRNFISPEGAMLDELQSKYDDIIFVVAGTNKTAADQTLIGAPADSINSIVVNATGFDGKTAEYSRRGPVLDFFKKPDVCAVGGDSDRSMHVCTPTGEGWKSGTSFSAPWIARKMAYLIQVLGLSREISKALVIDSAAGWDYDGNLERGYGQVPIRIEDVVRGRDDEIRFVLSGTSEGLDNYNYNIPVPVAKEKHPYIARATLCYFPKCDRRQGVDYTSTEMTLKFGRVGDDGKVKAIDDNRQGEEGVLIHEESARNLYRKWDNVKHIGEALNPRARGKKVYRTGMWGINVRTTERGNVKNGRGMPFGVVVTLKEINGVNRIDDFIQRCALRGWIVNKIDIQNRVDIYTASEIDIKFED